MVGEKTDEKEAKSESSRSPYELFRVHHVSGA